jgi:dTDP-4-dehydrorhamnose reductase
MPAPVQSLLLVGAKGMLASMVAKRAPANYAITAVDLPDFDMTDRVQVLFYVEKMQPDVIINCAAYTQVDRCETEHEIAESVNGLAVGHLAEAAKRVAATLVHISTDYVFDGQKDTPYLEGDPVNPQSTYGRSKLMGEQAILTSGIEKYFIVRTSWLFGPGGSNFVETILRLAAERNDLRIVADQVGSPTYTADLAEAIFKLLDLPANPQPPAPCPFGVYHFSNAGQCTWYEFAKEIIAQATQAGLSLKVKNIMPIKTEEYPLPAPRPAYSVFDKRKYIQATGQAIPHWRSGLSEYFALRNK